MNSKIKNLIKGIFTLAVFIATLVVIGKIIMLKSKDGYAQIQSYYKQIDNTVDVLFLGSSKVYCQIDTGILWDEYGISAFDLGGAEATTWNSYYYLREALKTQRPKVIIYDATVIGYRHNALEQDVNWLKTNSFGMHWNENRFNLIKENVVSREEFRDNLISLGSMHSRYNELTKNDFVDEFNSINYKGFDYRNDTEEFEDPTVAYEVIDYEVVNPKHEYYFRLMIDYAKQYDIPVIVMITPYVVTEQEQKYFNYIEDVCESLGVEFIDGNKCYKEIDFDFSEDMAEEMHVNLSGSKKLTEAIGEDITKKFNLTDHRGDPIYSSWEVDAERNRNNRRMEEEEN